MGGHRPSQLRPSAEAHLVMPSDGKPKIIRATLPMRIQPKTGERDAAKSKHERNGWPF